MGVVALNCLDGSLERRSSVKQHRIQDGSKGGGCRNLVDLSQGMDAWSVHSHHLALVHPPSCKGHGEAEREPDLGRDVHWARRAACGARVLGESVWSRYAWDEQQLQCVARLYLRKELTP